MCFCPSLDVRNVCLNVGRSSWVMRCRLWMYSHDIAWSLQDTRQLGVISLAYPMDKGGALTRAVAPFEDAKRKHCFQILVSCCTNHTTELPHQCFETTFHTKFCDLGQTPGSTELQSCSRVPSGMQGGYDGDSPSHASAPKSRICAVSSTSFSSVFWALCIQGWMEVCKRVIYSPMGGGMFGCGLWDQVVKENRGPDRIPILVEKCIAYVHSSARSCSRYSSPGISHH